MNGGWPKALGHQVWYCMTVEAHIASAPFGECKAERPFAFFPTDGGSEARIDDSPSPSVGPGAALALDVEPERETWHRTARDLYAKALKNMPGQGRLHRHLAVMSR